MKRTVAAALAAALVAGCSGTNVLLPSASSGTNLPQSRQSDGGMVRVLMRIRIPHRRRRERVAHPSTISTLTKSVSIAVNSAPAQVFNATPSSPGCTAGSKGTTCTFAVRAKPGTDRFTVTTYGSVNATGTALDRGITGLVPIVAGKANSVAVTLGPLVTTTANSGIGSLRYAVGSANSGDTVMFSLPNGSTITLTSPIKNQGSVKLAGPGAASLSVSGGSAHQLFSNLGTLTISGLTLTHGKAAVSGEPGGVIKNVGALILAGDVVGNSSSVVSSLRRAPRALSSTLLRAHRLRPHCTTTYAEGGAVYNDGAMTVTGTTFTNNVVTSNMGTCVQGEGGAIFNDQEGSLSSSGDVYSGNSAESGGAVFSSSVAATTFTGDTFSANTGCVAATGCVTSGCGATSCSSFALGQGAAIADNGVGITVTNSTFLNNVAGGATAGSQGAGGAIFLNSQLPTITNSTFTGNLAGGGNSSCSFGAGGAIIAENAVELDTDVFKNNSATGDNTSEGGAVAAVSAVQGSGDTFTGNTVVASGGACSTTATAIGGAIFDQTQQVTITKSTFTSNTATANSVAGGGAIGGADTLILSGSTFTSNAALGNGNFGATSVTAAGGAVYAQTVAKISTSMFTSNSATIEGPGVQEAAGGAVVVSSGALISNGNLFKLNVAAEKTGAQTAAGGAVAVVSSQIISNGDTFMSNSATSPSGIAEGGGLFVETGGLISGSTFSSNKASAVQAVGGGLAFVSTGAATLTHVTIASNSATGTSLGGGGGLVDGTGAQISNSTISSNTASTLGGGSYTVSNAEFFVNSTIAGNSVTKAIVASAGGGGIYDGDGVELDDTTVANNTATIGGAGPAGGGGLVNVGGLLMIGSTISGNKVLGTSPGGDGGGGILSGDAISAVNDTISNNTSSMSGGGLMQVGSASVAFGNSTFYSNTAAAKGGNIDNLQQMTLTNSVVGAGHAGTGGNDVYNASGATLTSNGYDIFGSTFVGGGTYTAGTADKFANPLLLALSNNGGPTFTNADQATSPGKAYIPYSGGNCGSATVATDQRGFTRGTGGKCDAGAYEYAGVATATRHRIPKSVFRHKGRHRGVYLPLREVHLRALRPSK